MGLLKHKGLKTKEGGSESALSEDRTIVIPPSATKAEIEAAINATPDDWGMHNVILMFQDGTPECDIAISDKRNGFLHIEAENALSIAGINQPVEFIFSSNKQISFTNCNLTVYRDSIKFTAVSGGQSIFVTCTDSEIVWIDSYPYDDCENCNQETIILQGPIKSVSNNGTFQGSLSQDVSYCTLENELNENHGNRVIINNSSRNTIPFKTVSLGLGDLEVVNSSDAFEEDGVGMIAVTSHAWDVFGPLPQLTTPVLTVGVETSDTIPLTWLAVLNAASYSLERSLDGATGWTEIATPASGDTSYDDTGRTASTNYYYKLTAIANPSTHLDSDAVIAMGTTEAITDSTAPVATFSPLNAATDIAIDGAITITFDEAILNADGSEITDTNVDALITLKETDAVGLDVAFDAVINAGKTVITITPSANLSNSQAYYVAIAAVEDAAGNETTASNATFTTIAASGGVNMVSNGTFDDATGWNIDAQWAIAGGDADYTNTAHGNLRQADGDMISSIVANTAYTLEFDIIGGSGNARFILQNYYQGTVYIVEAGYANGHNSVNFTTPADVELAGICLRARSSGDSYSIDNIEIYE